MKRDLTELMRTANLEKLGEAERAERRAAEHDRRMCDRWIVALACCGLTIPEIATVAGLMPHDVLSRLYFYGLVHYDRIELQPPTADAWRALWSADDPNAPPGLLSALSARGLR